MQARIELDETAPEAPFFAGTGLPPLRALNRLLATPDGDDSATDPLMLYVAEEPHVGLEFSYNGLDWRIVEYDDGWIAKMVME